MKVIKSYKNLASPLTLPYLVINSHDVTEHVGLVREHLQATYKPVGKFYKSGQPKCNVLVFRLLRVGCVARHPLQERVELATTFLELQGVDSKGSVEFLTYSTVVLAVLRATGVELLDTGASNLGVNSAAVPQPKLQLFDLGSWYLVHPPKVPSMRWTGFRALLDKYAPARSGWIRTVLAREGGLGSTRLMVSTLLLPKLP